MPGAPTSPRGVLHLYEASRNCATSALPPAARHFRIKDAARREESLMERRLSESAFSVGFFGSMTITVCLPMGERGDESFGRLRARRAVTPGRFYSG